MKVKKLIDSLAVITASKVCACRDGIFKDIPIEDLVMDDLIAVENGNQIGADCEVLFSDGIEVNESMITGESRPVRKKAGDTLWSGSFMVAGSGKARVIHVGKDNYATKLANQAKDKNGLPQKCRMPLKRLLRLPEQLSFR